MFRRRRINFVHKSMPPRLPSAMAYDSDDVQEVASEEEVLELTSGSEVDADEEAYWLDSTEVSDASSDSCELLETDQHPPIAQACEPALSFEHSDLLQHCLDYCSHAWPSPDVHESLLHSMLDPGSHLAPTPSGLSSETLKDPADLSALPFSDGSDQESSKEACLPNVGNSSDAKNFQADGNLGLRASALNPQLTSKHAKKAHMQRLVHQEIERKRLEEVSNGKVQSMRRRQAEALLPVLEDVGYSLQDVESLLESCGDEPHKIQLEVDSLLEVSKSKSQTWLTSVTRKRQRETGLKEQRKQELGVLKSKFGDVMRELEGREENTIPEVTPEVTPLNPLWSDAAADESRPEHVATNSKSGMPEVSSIKHMSRGDCRKLLCQMRPLVHAPAALYKALAARAVEEYARCRTPLTFHDSRQITFWQFAGSERSGCGPDRSTFARNFLQSLYHCIVCRLKLCCYVLL